MDNDTISIELTKEEAIVLFELLGRLKDDDLIKIEDRAEQRVLWNIECILESKLSESLSDDYKGIVEKARNNVRNENEE